MSQFRTCFGSVMRDKGFSIGRLQRDASIARNTARRIQRDEIQRLDLGTTSRVCRALGVKLEDVVVEVPDRKDPDPE